MGEPKSKPSSGHFDELELTKGVLGFWGAIG